MKKCSSEMYQFELTDPVHVHWIVEISSTYMIEGSSRRISFYNLFIYVYSTDK